MEVDLDALDESPLKPKLASVQILKLHCLSLKCINHCGDTFCRIFSQMFPNLEDLMIHPCPNYDIESHLDQFVNLKTYFIESYI